MRWIALLRAINVGGHTVPMARLREIFAGLGCHSVETFIASGNVAFESDLPEEALEKRLEEGLRKELGYEVTTFLRTPAELAEAVDYEPFGQGGVSSADGLYIAFLKDGLSPKDRESLASLVSEVNDFADRGRDLYWLRRQMGESRVMAALEKTLGRPLTIRNMKTVRKLAAKYSHT